MKNLVIGNGVDTAKRKFYYEKREKVLKSRNRMRDEAVNGGFYYGKREKMHKFRNRK